jgi:L-fuconolactonase
MSSDRVDAHQHFWRYSPQTHAWIDDSMAVLKRDFLPSDLESLLIANGFGGCVAVQAQQDAAETEWLLALAEEHGFIRGVVGWVDLLALDVEGELERLSQRPKLRGVRHIVQSEPDGFMAGASFRRGIAALERCGLTYDVLIYERQIPQAIDLVRAFPRQRFVVDHIAKPDIKGHRSGETNFDAWRDGMRTLSQHDNVFCKLSGMVTEGDWHNWTAADFAPYVEVVLGAFTPERCMIGSDWPVCTLAGSYGSVTGLVLDYIARLSPGEQAAVRGGSAMKAYRL